MNIHIWFRVTKDKVFCVKKGSMFIVIYSERLRFSSNQYSNEIQMTACVFDSLNS